MLSPRISWSKEEQTEKADILKKFWEKLILPGGNDFSIQQLKDRFLISRPQGQMTIDEWSKHLDSVLQPLKEKGPKNEKAKRTFFELFDHIPSIKSVGLATGFVSKSKELKHVNVTDADVADIKRYTLDRKISVSISAGSMEIKEGKAASNTTQFNTDKYQSSDIFSIHSIAKLFTGVLILILMQKEIITPPDLKNKIPLSRNAKDMLLEHAPLVLERIESDVKDQGITLFDAMTHMAGLGVGKDSGLGDYYGKYINEIKANIKEGKEAPVIAKMEEFLRYVPNSLGNIGQYAYSNTGILITGVAVEQLYRNYKEKHPEERLPELDFNGLLEQYVIKPAKMTYFKQFTEGLEVRFDPDISGRHTIGSPGGGYFTNIENLEVFSKWLYEKVNEKPKGDEPKFADLLKDYGVEFSQFAHSIIEHTGDGPASSAYFSLNWETGNVVIVLCDSQTGAASEVGRLIEDHIMCEHAKPAELKEAKLADPKSIIESSALLESAYKKLIESAQHTDLRAIKDNLFEWLVLAQKHLGLTYNAIKPRSAGSVQSSSPETVRDLAIFRTQFNEQADKIKPQLMRDHISHEELKQIGETLTSLNILGCPSELKQQLSEIVKLQPPAHRP